MPSLMCCIPMGNQDYAFEIMDHNNQDVRNLKCPDCCRKWFVVPLITLQRPDNHHP